MTKVKLILKGLHDNHYKEDGSYLIDPLTSSVTLIQTEKNNILVDTGTPNFKEKILENLAKEGLKAENIDYLILTHNHLDHCFNAHLFPRALIYTQIAFWHWQDANCHIFPKGISSDVVPGITLLHTPGHSKDSLSVFVKDAKEKKWLIAGDAVSLHYLENGSLRNRVGEEGVRSIRKILDLNPDYIVPGHGEVFTKTEIDKLREFVR